MPGLVKMIACKEGDSVEAGTTVVILEAMKMQNPLIAPISGVVRILHCVTPYMHVLFLRSALLKLCMFMFTCNWIVMYDFMLSEPTVVCSNIGFHPNHECHFKM